MEADRLLDDLDAAQREAVTTDAAPLRILAGAGSGKTRVLTRRLAHRVAVGTADPRHALVLTFTRRAASELRSRLGVLGIRDEVAAGTFHAIAYAQLRARWADRGVRPPDLLERKLPVVAKLVPSRGAAIDVLAELDWAAAQGLGPDDYAAELEHRGRRPAVSPTLVVATMRRYADHKRERRLVDFDDLLRLGAQHVRTDPDAAAATRWRYRHVFVDEFQDVNPLQFDLLRAWLGDRVDLCVVGDPRQAIYAWNGADAAYLTRFERWFPDATTVELTHNHRSTPQIVAAGAAVLGHGTPVPATDRPEGPTPTVAELADELAEADAVARAVRDRHAPGTRWSSQAVLVRTNAQGVLVAEALRAAGVPHRIRGGAGLLDRPEVRSALGELRRHPGPFAVAVADLADAVSPAEVPPDPAPAGAAGRSGAPIADDGPIDDERRANLDMLVRLAGEYTRVDRLPSADGFSAWLTAALGTDLPHRDAVDVATFHAAKGLEWPVVHLAGLEDGLVPIGHARTPAELAEERRLLHVAVTRAEHELHLTWARRRTVGNRAMEREPSPWLHPLIAATGPAAPTLPARRGLGLVRDELGDRVASRAPDALLDALRHWRATRARVAGVEPRLVLDDAAVVELARSRPSSIDALAAVTGVGPMRAARFADDLLTLVAAHADRSDA